MSWRSCQLFLGSTVQIIRQAGHSRSRLQEGGTSCAGSVKGASVLRDPLPVTSGSHTPGRPLFSVRGVGPAPRKCRRAPQAPSSSYSWRAVRGPGRLLLGSLRGLVHGRRPVFDRHGTASSGRAMYTIRCDHDPSTEGTLPPCNPSSPCPLFFSEGGEGICRTRKGARVLGR